MTDDQRPQHRAALNVASAYVARLDVKHLELPTPCAGWNVRQLLEHSVGQHFGFAAAVVGEASASDYLPVPFTPASWADSVRTLTDAFARADLDAEVLEIELHPTRPLPVATLVAAQWLDTVVHTWDLAVSLGERYDPGAEVAEAMQRMSVVIPDDDRRERPGSAFARGVAITRADPWSQTLALLGRDPEWTPPAAP